MAPACSLVQWQTLKCGLALSLGLVLGCYVPLEALVPFQKCAKSDIDLLAATAEGFYWSMPSSQEVTGKKEESKTSNQISTHLINLTWKFCLKANFTLFLYLFVGSSFLIFSLNSFFWLGNFASRLSESRNNNLIFSKTSSLALSLSCRKNISDYHLFKKVLPFPGSSDSAPWKWAWFMPLLAKTRPSGHMTCFQVRGKALKSCVSTLL